MKKIIIGFFLLIFLLYACTSTAEYKANEEKNRAQEAIDKEIEIGRAVLAKLAGKYGIVKDDAATEYLNKLGKSIGMYTERTELDYYFAILATDEVNAYALPGGYILISAGALKRVNSPEALIGIISHELGHINKKHILQQVKIEVSYNFFEILARFIAGPKQIVTTMAKQISDKVEEALFVNGLTSDEEYEADKYAVTLMQALNVNPLPYTDYITKLGNSEADQSLAIMDKTHPKAADRVAKLQQYNLASLPALKSSSDFNSFINSVNNLNLKG